MSSRTDNALMIFLKYPEPGKVKTRLAKVIGNEKACTAYRLLAEGVMKNIYLKDARPYAVWIFFTPFDRGNEIKDWLKPLIGDNRNAGTEYVPQEGNTLGERMSNAFKQVFQEKHYKRGIVIGTDCPGVDGILLGDAFGILSEKDIVIGPCRDGGYYLLGISGSVHLLFNRQPVLDLFMDIDWSTDKVLKQTMGKIHKNNLSCHTLTTLADIDRAEDLYQYFPDFLAEVKEGFSCKKQNER